MILKNLHQRISLKKFIYLTFLVDSIGNFNVFTWNVVDEFLVSNELLDIIDKYSKSNFLKISNDMVELIHLTNLDNNLDAICGWIKNHVQHVVDYVFNKYGNLSDEELENLVKYLFNELKKEYTI